MSLCALENISKTYGGRVVVENVSLTIQNGEFLSLLGPSGCGKSTTLRMLAGFEQPDSGTISFRGQDITRMPVRRRDLNMVFQNYALFPHMTVFDNVAFGLQMQKKPARDIQEEVGKALELVRMRGFEQRLPAQLSGGQQQRIALARAIAPRPAMLLLDEPLGALDLKLRKEMQRELKALQRTLGVTFIFVTHDQDEALAMSDRIAIMFDGKIAQLGAPQEIYERPLSSKIAAFIGEVNLVAVELGDDSLAFSPKLNMKLQIQNRAELGSKRHAIVAIRPEAWKIAPADAAPTNHCRGTVLDVQYFGHQRHVVVRTPQAQEVTILWNGSGESLQPGQQVALSLRESSVRAIPEGST